MAETHARRKIRINNFLGDNLQDRVDRGIQAIPSIIGMLKQCDEFEAIIKLPKIRLYLEGIGVDSECICNQCRSIKELAQHIDRFDDLFSKFGWIAYWNMDTKILKGTVEKGNSGDVKGAQTDLVLHYNPDRVLFELKRMNQIKAFQARMPLAKKALVDYKEKRYHACIPIVLALLDGMVNEICQKKLNKRCGFFSDNADLIAWDSIAAHSKGLNELKRYFGSGRYTTTSEKIEIPYRNGILHGMDLGYDNEVVAAKTWAALFATSEWAINAEQDSLEPPKTGEIKTPLEVILEAVRLHKQTEEDQIQISEWKPRSLKIGKNIPITGAPEKYDNGTPERKLVDFFSYWKDKKFGCMAKCVPNKSGISVNKLAGDLKKRYDSNNLKSFELEGICDTASPRSVIKAKLTYEWYGKAVEKSFEFILINYDDSWKQAVRGTPGVNWYIYNWDCYF